MNQNPSKPWPKMEFTSQRIAGYWCVTVEGSDDSLWIDGPEALVRRMVECYNSTRDLPFLMPNPRQPLTHD